MKSWIGDAVSNQVNNATNNGQTDYKLHFKKSDINLLQSRSLTLSNTNNDASFTADFKHNVIDNSVNIFVTDRPQDYQGLII